ncbi:MAG: hypothetical protein EXR79_15465 [Myxococcales bacterium]|nr:hypothetical protein [Myxococcales bacterium]
MIDVDALRAWQCGWLVAVVCAACAEPLPGGGGSPWVAPLDASETAGADTLPRGPGTSDTLLNLDGSPRSGEVSGATDATTGDGKADLTANDATPADTTAADTTAADTTAADTTAGDTAPNDTAGPDVQDTATPAPSGLTDPNCLDGLWSETLPAATAALDGVKATFAAKPINQFVLDLLAARYPTGKHLVEGGLTQQDCIAVFLQPQQKASASGVVTGLSTVVHECGHMFDFKKGGFSGSAFVFTPSLTLTCPGAAHQGNNPTFARSLIKSDEFYALRPACPKQGANGCDIYANVYLSGDPKDAKFESGDQGFNTVLEETVQYVNSLATGYAYADHVAGNISERDGILTFLWYVERYLRMARLQFPAQHKFLVGNECWRKAILTTWGRAAFFLGHTKGISKLTIDGAKIEPLVMNPDLLAEIDLVRKAHGCSGTP